MRSVEASEQVLADVEEPETEVPHEPLVGRAGREIYPRCADVDRHGAGGLDDIGVDMGAMGVRQVADGLEVVLKAVVHRNERDLDEPRPVVDDLRQVLQVDEICAHCYFKKASAEAA